ncbi:chromosomal replication initiator protein DnaA [Parablautia sp. Marseille-Q6255]|uniref:chromosomal replication initiator protein DnaA n=1 Tax=Parablautia sp. Marseille-Q6255 TaxID=3039593 RepID=UPI0024BC3BE5|nr:chromosomal replication initiator protein DnaA [Parablautia sp. Marseille-Q6255]
MDILKEKWEEILYLVKVEHELSDISFKTWLQPLQLHDVSEHTVTILVPSEQMGIDYITKKYMFPIKVAIAELTGREYDISFILPEQAKKYEKKKKFSAVNLLDNSSNAEKANLNPKYTFDTFVVGNNNKFAHAAALAVAESPGKMYNPLFIHGGAGLGKTHLMHSIAHFVLQQNPQKKVLYVTSETFTNELIDSIRNGNTTAMTKFREKYRNVDVLLIDDIQFIIGKEATQEEFFHTFNDLHGNKKQIIISSDKPPKDIETLEARLRSRFEWGLIADISSPDFETRMAILHKKEENDGYDIDNEVIKYIAMNIKSNIRELEGALNKLVALSNLENREITVRLAEEALKDIISPDEKKEITPALIVSIVAEHFHITENDIKSNKRNTEVVYPRQIAMYLCSNMTSVGLKKIGAELGGRDHSTILHGSKKIASEIKTSDTVRNTIEILKKKINPT